MTLSPTSWPSGGGIAPVTCVLARDNGFDVRLAGSYPILWDALYDNYWDFTPLAAIPAGLGLTFAFGGTSANMTTTAAGTWGLAYAVSANADATWTAALDTGFGTVSLPPAAQASSQLLTTVVLTLPTAVTLSPNIVTHVAATTNPYPLNGVSCIITRLA